MRSVISDKEEILHKADVHCIVLPTVRTRLTITGEIYLVKEIFAKELANVYTNVNIHKPVLG